MRAVCSICSDLFESSEDNSIAAVQCGHTFHTECLVKWLSTSNTCPHCRKQVNAKTIIKKLYFDDAGELEEESGNSDQIRNELSSVKSKLYMQEKEKNNIIKERDSFVEKAEEAEKNKIEIQNTLKQEQSMNNSLRKQLCILQKQQKLFEMEKKEFQRIKTKLNTLQDMEAILKGSETDASDIFMRNRDTSDNRLSTYCSVLKREYEQAKLEKKALKNHLDKVKRDLIDKTNLLQIKTKEFSNFTELIKRSEEDLKQAEKEKDIFKAKLGHLKKAIRSPCPSASSSFVETLLENSPLPGQPSTPQLTKMNDSHGEIDLNSSDVIPSTPEVVKSQPLNKFKRPLEKNVTIVNTSSNLEQNSSKRMKKESDVPIPHMGAFNIFKKKSGMGSFESAVRKGYDGFGGHTTFTQHQLKSRQLPKKKTSHGSSLLNKQKPLPQFPKLDELIYIN